MPLSPASDDPSNEVWRELARLQAENAHLRKENAELRKEHMLLGRVLRSLGSEAISHVSVPIPGELLHLPPPSAL